MKMIRVSIIFATWTMFAFASINQDDTFKTKRGNFEYVCTLEQSKDIHRAPLDKILLFPQPKVTIFDNTSTLLALSFSDRIVFATSHRMDSILQRFCDTARSYRSGTTHVSINIDRHLKQYKEGSYDMDLIPSMDIISRASSEDAVHSLLSTLSQLLSQRPVMTHLPLHISDWPEYSWRGLLVDVSRHFIPIKLLKRCLDAMEVSKLNVLHLHLTDAQSFPLRLRDVPLNKSSSEMLRLSDLASMGSFDNATKTYTARMLSDLVAYAANRGIAIVPEIDMPAHSFSWGKAFPDIVLPYNRSTSKVKQLDMVPLDISNPRLLVIIEAIIQQIVEIFPFKYIHVGGDEVRTEPWLETPHVKSWMTQQGYGSAHEAGKAFEARVFDLVKQADRTPLVWQGILDSHSMPNESTAVVQPWKCWGGLALRAAETALRRGHPVVMSSCWYLDYETDWLTFLSADQGADIVMKLSAQSKVPDSLKQHRSNSSVEYDHGLGGRAEGGILGGEGSMWTEKVDHTNLECRMWPRATAIAARLWGAGTTTIGLGLSELTRIKTYSSIASRGRHSRLVEIPYENAATLHASFIHLREYLVAALNMSAAQLVFHYLADQAPPTSNRSTGRASPFLSDQELLVSRTALNEDEALSLIKKYRMSRTLTSDQSQQPSITAGHARLTAQCLSLPQEIQRPISQRKVFSLQLNAAAADGSSTRMKELLRWLATKASEGALYIGFCELNGWQAPVSKTDLMANHPTMAARAALSGFAYSHIMVSSQPYNIGIMSSLPFDVVVEYGPPLFQRGVLHVYIFKLSLHVIVAHLHAHDPSQRGKEAEYMATHILHPLLSKNQKVIVQGDLNTLSPFDSKQHEATGLIKTLKRSDYSGFIRLGKKFLDPSTGKVDYRPMETLLKTGMTDACTQSCPCQTETGTSRWHASGDDECSRCMIDRCLHSVPTNYSSEWADDPSSPQPGVRVDYILVSPAIVKEAAVASAAAKSDGFDHHGIDAKIEINRLTGSLSDHYPMEIHWSVAEEYDLFRKRER